MKKNKNEERKKKALLNMISTKYKRIKPELAEQYMLPAEVMKLLGVTRSQLFHWDSKGLKISKKSKEKHLWRKFSIFDLLGFEVLKELLGFGLNVKECKFVIDWLRHDFNNNPYLIFHFAYSNRTCLLLDIKAGQVVSVSTKMQFEIGDTMHSVERPRLLLPLLSIFTRVFQKIQKQNFRVVFTPPKSAVVDTFWVIFIVDNKKIEFDISIKDYFLLRDNDFYKFLGGK